MSTRSGVGRRHRQNPLQPSLWRWRGSNMSSLHELTAPDEHFFEARRKVFPKAVDGPFRRLKWAIMAVALLIYYVTPWLRWNRGPWAPDQAVLVDLAHRRFYMFSIEIWPHEFYYVAGLL